MSSPALDRETVQQQKTWSVAADRFAASWAARVATSDTASTATAQLRAVFAHELAVAQAHGIAAARRIAAAGAGGDAGPLPDAAAPTVDAKSLNRALAVGWRQAGMSPDSKQAHRVRKATVGRLVDAQLMDAWRDGMVAAMIANPQVIGWRRVDHAGACGACFALTDGDVHSTSDPFPAHPRCRCIQQPVLLGVNDQTRVQSPQQRWDALTTAQQNAMFDHRGGAHKADLIRSGKVGLSQLITVEPRRPDQAPVIAEASLKKLSPPARLAPAVPTPIP